MAEQQLKVLRLGDPSFSPNQFKIGEKSSIVLNPGDILYHPAGIWHRVNCLEDSISINVSLTGASYAEIFCSSLQQLLWENPSWRSVASSNPLEAHSTMQSLLSNLPEVLRNICPADLLPAPVFNTNKPADEQAPSSSSQDENSDEESEAEDSEAEEETNIIDVEACSIEDLLELLPLIPTTGKRSKSTERSLPAIADIKFRINPLAMVVNVEQFSEQSSANDSSCSQVHCGYGNETLESLCRSTVRVPKRLELAWSKLISLSEQARSRRIQSLQSTKPSDRVGEEVAISDLKQAKSSDSDLEKLLIAASLAGLLSIAPRK